MKLASRLDHIEPFYVMKAPGRAKHEFRITEYE
jgi:hypothetical protein